jgi:hypothetical protein
MATNDSKAAEILRANLDEDERRLVEAEQLTTQLRAKVTATRAWLQAYGYMNDNGRPSASPAPSENGTRSTKDVMVEVLKERGAVRMVELTKAVNERGHAVTRGTVDATAKRYADTFSIQLKEKENWVTLRVT